MRIAGGDRPVDIGWIVQLLDQEGSSVFSADVGAAFGETGGQFVVDYRDANNGPVKRTPLDDPFLRFMAAQKVCSPPRRPQLDNREKDARGHRDLRLVEAVSGRGGNDKAFDITANHGVNNDFRGRDWGRVFGVVGAETHDDRIMARNRTGHRAGIK